MVVVLIFFELLWPYSYYGDCSTLSPCAIWASLLELVVILFILSPDVLLTFGYLEPLDGYFDTVVLSFDGSFKLDVTL